MQAGRCFDVGTKIFSNENNENIHNLKAGTQGFARMVVAQLKVGTTQDCSDSDSNTVTKSNMAIKAY